MPQKNSPKPPCMTRSKAASIFAVAVIFDALRAFFHFFVFFGPALAAILCTVVASNALGGGQLTTQITGGLCALGAGAVGLVGAAPIEAFGLIMAGAIGLAAFLTLGLWIVITNRRILKTVTSAPLQFAGSFAVAEIPFLGAFPVFSVIIWRLYGAQIKVERAALKKWEGEQATMRLQERSQQQLAAQTQQVAQQAQFAEQEAAHEEEALQTDAANDEKYAEGEKQNERSAGQPARRAEDSGAEELPKKPASIEADFSTMRDALSELNAKQNRTREENRKLLRARQIMQSVSIDVTETDPVLRAAYERARQGQKVSDGTDETRGGFVFDNVIRLSDKRKQGGQAATDASIPEEWRKAA